MLLSAQTLTLKSTLCTITGNKILYHFNKSNLTLNTQSFYTNESFERTESNAFSTMNR